MKKFKNFSHVLRQKNAQKKLKILVMLKKLWLAIYQTSGESTQPFDTKYESPSPHL